MQSLTAKPQGFGWHPLQKTHDYGLSEDVQAQRSIVRPVLTLRPAPEQWVWSPPAHRQFSSALTLTSRGTVAVSVSDPEERALIAHLETHMADNRNSLN